MKSYLLSILLLAPAMAICQDRLLNRFSQKVKDRVEQRTEEKMDKVLDKTEEKIRKDAATTRGSRNEPKKEAVETKPRQATASFESYSHYDFIPGENLVYAEDFSQDAIGEFPLKWSTNNQGQTVTIKGQSGHWLRLMKEGHFVSPYVNSLPANFTVEFDAILHLPENVENTSYADFTVRLMRVDKGDERARQFFINSFDSKADIRFTLQPYTDEQSNIRLESTSGGNLSA
jgi:hypothetical protein